MLGLIGPRADWKIASIDQDRQIRYSSPTCDSAGVLESETHPSNRIVTNPRAGPSRYRFSAHHGRRSRQGYERQELSTLIELVSLDECPFQGNSAFEAISRPKSDKADSKWSSIVDIARSQEQLSSFENQALSFEVGAPCRIQVDLRSLAGPTTIGELLPSSTEVHAGHREHDGCWDCYALSVEVQGLVVQNSGPIKCQLFIGALCGLLRIMEGTIVITCVKNGRRAPQDCSVPSSPYAR